MAICKDCLHNEVCKYGENRSNGGYCTGEKCKQFKDRAKYIDMDKCQDCTHYGDPVTCPMWINKGLCYRGMGGN